MGMRMKVKYLLYIILGVILVYIVVDFITKEVTDRSKSNEVQEISSDQNTDGNDSSVDLSQIQYAADFELTTLDGDEIKLSELRGKKVIVNFWATWCPPCIEEMPDLQSFYEKNKDNNIEILAVNLTNLDDGEEAVRSFVTEYGLTFPVPLDAEGEVGTSYGVFTIPTSYILDEEGRIFQKVVGAMDEQMMEDMINSIPN